MSASAEIAISTTTPLHERALGESSGITRNEMPVLNTYREANEDSFQRITNLGIWTDNDSNLQHHPALDETFYSARKMPHRIFCFEIVTNSSDIDQSIMRVFRVDADRHLE